MSEAVPRNIRPAFPIDVAREDVRSKFQEILGIDEIPTELDFDLGTSWEEDGLKFTQIKYPTYTNEIINATVAVPLDLQGARLPGVVGMPGTGSSSEEVLHRTLYRPKPKRGPLLGWGRELAKKNYAVLSFSPKGCVSRRRTIGNWEEETKLLAPYGRTQLGMLADEALRASLALRAMDIVDRSKIGFTGMSLGGLASWMAMSLVPWIKTSAAVCGVLGTMEQMIHYGNTKRHSSAIYIPQLLRYFDHPQIVASCIAPRPFMMIAPTEDDDMPKAGVDELINVVRPVYEKSGQSDSFLVHRPPGIHTYRLKYFDWVVDWFDAFLR